MTDVWTTLGTIKRIVKKGHHYGSVFESANHIIVSCASLTLIAQKRPNEKGLRLFPEAYPFKTAGYVSINSWKKDKLPPLTVEEAIDDINAILNQLPQEQRKHVLREFFPDTPKKEA